MTDQTTTRLSGSDERDILTEPRGPLPTGTPHLFGRYETWRVLGSGTFGRVFLARDAEMGRFVAIKAPKDPLAPDSHKVFLREARMLADIHHPNICPIHDVGVQGELPYIVMRYVSGGTLNDLIGRESPTPTLAIQFAEQIANALEEAHTHGIFHRDLKPANVLYDDKTRKLLLTDFGVAHWAAATQSLGGTPGTPLYMAPEQWGPGGPFGHISARTDVYSLGVILFRMLTGVRLFDGSVFELMAHHCQTPPRRPSEVCPGLDERFDELCLKALAKKQSDRYGSAKEFADIIAASLCPPAPPPADPEQLPFAEPQPEPSDSEPLFLKEPELGPPDDFMGCNPRANNAIARLHRVAVAFPNKGDGETSRGPDTFTMPATQAEWSEPAEKKPTRRWRFALLTMIGGVLFLSLGLAVFVFLLSSEKQPDPSSPPERAGKSKNGPKNDVRADKGEPVAPKRALPIPKDGETRDIEITPGVAMRFCWIPPGTAILGSPKGESERYTNEMEHEYTSKGFWMGKYEVTQDEWKAVMGFNPSKCDGQKENKAKGLVTSRFPVENVSWEMICGKSGKGGFLARVNAHDGIQKALGTSGKFCLPTEDEWEYAARGGNKNKQPFYWGGSSNGTQANICGNFPYGTTTKGTYLERTCAVDPTEDPMHPQYELHPWGLMHMHGNVWEWCDDLYDPVNNKRVVRGGSWSYYARVSRVAFRFLTASDDGDEIGFRLVIR